MPSRSTQSASDATAADAAIPTDVSSMQPRNVRKPSSLARPSIRIAGPHPAALRQLDVDPGNDPDEPLERVDRDSALVGDDWQRRSLLEPAELVETMGAERLLDQLHAEAFEVRQQGEGIVRRPARIGVDPDRAAVDGPYGLEGLRGRPARRA